MGRFIKNLCTKESAKRHLIQLYITVGLAAWTYVVISLLTDNWKWFALDEKYVADTKLLMSNIVGFLLMFVGVAIAGILTYWNAKKWMLPRLKRSGLYFLGAIPFVNRLVPEEMKNSWREKIEDLNSSDGTVVTYYDRWGKVYSDDGSLILLLAIPLGIIKALLKGIFFSVMNLVAAIGIPVLSPVFMVLGLIATQLLIDWNITAALIIAIVCAVAVVLVLIAQPIILFVKDKNHAIN